MPWHDGKSSPTHGDLKARGICPRFALQGATGSISVSLILKGHPDQDRGQSSLHCQVHCPPHIRLSTPIPGEWKTTPLRIPTVSELPYRAPACDAVHVSSASSLLFSICHIVLQSRLGPPMRAMTRISSGLHSCCMVAFSELRVER